MSRDYRRGKEREGREGRRAIEDSLETREGWWMKVREQEDKKRSSDEGECERESSDGVIALQSSSDKQHLRASVVK